MYEASDITTSRQGRKPPLLKSNSLKTPKRLPRWNLRTSSWKEHKRYCNNLECRYWINAFPVSVCIYTPRTALLNWRGVAWELCAKRGLWTGFVCGWRAEWIELVVSLNSWGGLFRIYNCPLGVVLNGIQSSHFFFLLSFKRWSVVKQRKRINHFHPVH